MNRSDAGLRLIVTADDFGIGLQTSRGIVEAHKNGPVTATSLMTVTGDHAKASIPLLDDCPNLDVGLHVVLTRCGEKPLVAGRSSGLVDRDGDFFPNGKLWVRALTGRLDRRGVADEITAQAEMFRTLTGRSPAYVDGHHHSHQLPTIRDALLDVMDAGLSPRVTRVTVESPGMIRKVGAVRPKRIAADWLGGRMRRTLSDRSAWANDSFFGMLSPADLARPNPWDHYLASLPPSGVVEWVVHPGMADDTLIGRDDYRADRPVELKALTDPATWTKFRTRLSRKSELVRREGNPPHST